MKDGFFGFDRMDQQLYLSCFSTKRFTFYSRNYCNQTQVGKLYSSFCQIVKGKAVFEIAGETIEGKTGDLFYMPEGALYTSDWTGTPEIEFIGTYFRFFATNDLGMLRMNHMHSTPLDRQFAFQKIEPLCGFAAYNEMSELLEDYHSEGQTQLMAFSRLYKLMALTFPHMKKQHFNTINPAILPAVTYIERNYMYNDPVSLYANLCHLSDSRFYHLFQGSMGRTPITFRNSLRVHHATLLLTESSQSIERISGMLGFESPEYFRRIFKRFQGLTPSEYRRQGSDAPDRRREAAS